MDKPILSFGKFRNYVSQPKEKQYINTIETELSDTRIRLNMAEDALSDIARGTDCPHVVAENYFYNSGLTSLNFKDER